MQLVDGKRNDKLSVHVRRLAARTTYVYRLQEGSCREGAPGGTDVAGWKYRRLKTNRARIGNATARSRTFRARQGTSYAVVVYSGDQVLLCAQLRTKSSRHHGGSDKAKGDEKRGKSEEKARGRSEDAPGRVEDKPRGRSEDAPGRAEDKPRGNSEDAPGRAEDKPRGNSEGSRAAGGVAERAPARELRGVPSAGDVPPPCHASAVSTPPNDLPSQRGETWNDTEAINRHREMTPSQRVALAIEVSRAALLFAEAKREADERDARSRLSGSSPALNASGVAYVIVGGLAVAAHGVVRATRDLDLVPEPSAENLDRLAADAHGPRSRASDRRQR